MKSRPPRIASWLLQRFGPWYYADALAGDLLEDFERHPSAFRYWREVLSAIAIARSERVRVALVPVLHGLVLSWGVLAVGLWGANALEEHRLHRCPGCF